MKRKQEYELHCRRGAMIIIVVGVATVVVALTMIVIVAILFNVIIE